MRHKFYKCQLPILQHFFTSLFLKKKTLSYDSFAVVIQDIEKQMRYLLIILQPGILLKLYIQTPVI